MLFLLADITILLDSLPGSKTGVGVAAATAGIATDTSCAITLPPGPLPCRDYNTNESIQSNLDYPNLDYPAFSIIRTFPLVPIWS